MIAHCSFGRKHQFGLAAANDARRAYHLIRCVFAAAITLLLGTSTIHAAEPKPVFAVDVKGAIGVATSVHLCETLNDARVKCAELVVVRLDTPGGLLTSTRDVIQCILGSAVPVAVYISPSGARANVELKHVDLNETMVRAIAKQAEAERLRRAKIIDAVGELQAADRLMQAGVTLAKQPEAMQLRYLGTLVNIAGEKNSTIVFPMPMDLVKFCSDLGKSRS